MHQQARGFTRLQEWDFDATPPTDYPLLLHFPYLELYRKQVVKQADLVLAMHWCGDAFTAEEKARNFAYYERRTVRDSSLSACAQAVLAAEVGHLELAHDYLAEAALIDLPTWTATPATGVHVAAAGRRVAGAGGGLRAACATTAGMLSFAPRLPSRIDRLAFSLLWRGLRLRVTVRPRGGGVLAARRRR